MFRRKTYSRSGYSIMEVIYVVVIMGTMFSLSYLSFFGEQDDIMKNKKNEIIMNYNISAIRRHYNIEGYFPRPCHGKHNLDHCPNQVAIKKFYNKIHKDTGVVNSNLLSKFDCYFYSGKRADCNNDDLYVVTGDRTISTEGIWPGVINPVNISGYEADYALDAWGNKISYFVLFNMTLLGARDPDSSNMTIQDSDALFKIADLRKLLYCTEHATSDTDRELCAHDNSVHVLTAIMSHGKEGMGAWKKDGDYNFCRFKETDEGGTIVSADYLNCLFYVDKFSGANDKNFYIYEVFKDPRDNVVGGLVTIKKGSSLYSINNIKWIAR